MNTNRGLYVNRPFYVVSRMWMNRVITYSTSHTMLIQSRKANDKRQMWRLKHIISKTIKTLHDEKTPRSLDIRGGNAYAYATDSRWY
jgi:hypothetical protein